MQRRPRVCLVNQRAWTIITDRIEQLGLVCPGLRVLPGQRHVVGRHQVFLLSRSMGQYLRAQHCLQIHCPLLLGRREALFRIVANLLDLSHDGVGLDFGVPGFGH